MSYTRYVPVPDGINRDVSPAGQQTMLSLIGNPRAKYSAACQNPTNPKISALMVTAKAGPLRVTGLKKAVESLDVILQEVRVQYADIYDVLGHMGMLCARYVRGSKTSISNHSWGSAIDLTLEGKLDARGDGYVQEGLVKIAPVFNKHGWFWGAGFRTEDGMHFECSDQLIRRWAAEGHFGEDVVKGAQVSALISLGDRGPVVFAIQESLNQHGASLLVDGDFGRNTLAAVMAFQTAKGLVPDGVVGQKTKKLLGVK